MNNFNFGFMKACGLAVSSMRKLTLVILSMLGVLAVVTPAESSLPPTQNFAIDRVDTIREKLLRHDRESNSDEKIKLASWPNWRNWQNFPNYWRNY